MIWGIKILHIKFSGPRAFMVKRLIYSRLLRFSRISCNMREEKPDIALSDVVMHRATVTFVSFCTGEILY